MLCASLLRVAIICATFNSSPLHIGLCFAPARPAAPSTTNTNIYIMLACFLVASWSFFTTAVRPRSSPCHIPARMQLPAHLHEPYTRAEDAYLWANQEEDLEVVAEELGRGPKSCRLRLERLRNPKSSGHKRLFGTDDDEECDGKKLQSLRPMRECIQRIIYDPLLDGGDFTIGYHDRFKSEPCEAPFDAPNKNVAGAERALVQALPEHRILYLKYRRRLVWHKEQRLDDVFGSR